VAQDDVFNSVLSQAGAALGHRVATRREHTLDSCAAWLNREILLCQSPQTWVLSQTRAPPGGGRYTAVKQAWLSAVVCICDNGDARASAFRLRPCRETND
jgi:hypothetical protein